MSVGGLRWGAAVGAFYFMTLLQGHRWTSIAPRRRTSLFSCFDGQVTDRSAIVWKTVDGYQRTRALQAPPIHLLGRMLEVRLGCWRMMGVFPFILIIRGQIRTEVGLW